MKLVHEILVVEGQVHWLYILHLARILLLFDQSGNAVHLADRPQRDYKYLKFL